MKDEQVMIKFLRRNKNGKEWVPKPYIFKLTPKNRKEFNEYLQKGNKRHNNKSDTASVW